MLLGSKVLLSWRWELGPGTWGRGLAVSLGGICSRCEAPGLLTPGLFPALAPVAPVAKAGRRRREGDLSFCAV